MVNLFEEITIFDFKYNYIIKVIFNLINIDC